MRQLLTALALAAGAAPASAGFVVARGEVDVAIDYDGATLTTALGLAFDPAEPVVPAADVVFQANLPTAAVTVPSAAFAFTGVGVGGPLYVIPQVEDPDLPYIGLVFGEDQDDNPLYDDLVAGSGRLEFLGATGPGVVSVFASTNAGPDPLVVNGVGSLAAPFFVDTHYNYAFSQPGRYAVSVRGVVDLVAGGTLAGEAVTLSFDIAPTAVVPVPPTALLAAAAAGLAAWRRRAV